MKKILLVLCVFGLCVQTAYADFYRASGGGVYELYVNDCSETNMRRTLDKAVADKRAVITSVKCAENIEYDERTDIIINYEWQSSVFSDVCQYVPVRSYAY